MYSKVGSRIVRKSKGTRVLRGLHKALKSNKFSHKTDHNNTRSRLNLDKSDLDKHASGQINWCHMR